MDDDVVGVLQDEKKLSIQKAYNKCLYNIKLREKMKKKEWEKRIKMRSVDLTLKLLISIFRVSNLLECDHVRSFVFCWKRNKSIFPLQSIISKLLFCCCLPLFFPMSHAFFRTFSPLFYMNQQTSEWKFRAKSEKNLNRKSFPFIVIFSIFIHSIFTSFRHVSFCVMAVL